MNKKVQNQVNALKEFVVYNYNNGNLGLFLNGFAQRFLYLEQLKDKDNNEEYKWLSYLFESMGVKPVFNKGGKITYQNLEISKEKEEEKNEKNDNQNKKFFQKKENIKNLQSQNGIKLFPGLSFRSENPIDLLLWLMS